MPTMILTADAVNRAKAGPTLVELRDAKSKGLALRITPAGVKSWTLRYRLKDGTQRRISLGQYPAVSLAQARDKALATLSAVASDRDPAGEKKLARSTAKREKLDTLSVLAERYFADAEKGRHRHGGRAKRKSTLALETYYWTKHLKPEFGSRPIRTITRAEIQTFVSGLNAPSAARQCRVVFQRLFTYARWLELVDLDPSRFVHVDNFTPRDRVLTDDELKAVWQAFADPSTVADAAVSPALATAVLLAAVTLQRRGEVIGIDTREVDLAARTWTIPGEKTKNHRIHVVPLSDKAVELVKKALALRPKSVPGPLFPSPRHPGRSMSADGITHAFLRVRAELKLTDISPHDLRRTGATALTSERIAIPRFIVSRVLNHASDKGDAAAVTAVYDRNEYLAEKRRALDAWAALLDEIVSGKKRAPNVVSIAG
jgi:integrase